MPRSKLFSVSTLSVMSLVMAAAGCPPPNSLFPKCDDAENPCPPVDPAYPEDPTLDGVSSQAGRACQALRASGCGEGYRDSRTGKTCFERLQNEATLVAVPYQCLIEAKNAEAIRACGTKDTLRYRCRPIAVMADGGKIS